MQVGRITAEAAIAELRLTDSNEVRSQPSNGVLAHLGGIEGEEYAEAKV